MVNVNLNMYLIPNKHMETQQVTSQPTNLSHQSTPMASLLIPISYALAAVIVLAGLGAFLRQLFNLGKD